MSPADDLQRRSSVEEDSNEQEGIAEGGSAGAGEGGRAGVEGFGRGDEDQLPQREAVVEEISGGGGSGLETRECGAQIEPRSPGQRAPEDPEAGAGKIQRRRADALWTHLGGGAFIQRGPPGSSPGNAASVDAGRGTVEQSTPAQAASEAARAPGALRRTGAVGRQFP